MAPIIALKKTDQKKVVKKTKQITKKVKAGKLPISKRAKIRQQKRERPQPGLIYIGHLPHGFYEEEMRAYFKQFGRVTNLKVCRSRNTGNSKGYGYVEFLHPEVAKIAAETMNNYVMFKKRLVAQFIPHEKRPNHIFKTPQSMPGDYSKLRRREQVNATKNKTVSDQKHLSQAKSRANRLAKRLERINKLGVDYNLKPVDVPKNLPKK